MAKHAATSRHALRRFLCSVGLACTATTLLTFAKAAPMSAETDSLASQCIYVDGVKRACAYNLYVSWGSGISWQVGGQLVDDRGDSCYEPRYVKDNS